MSTEQITPEKRAEIRAAAKDTTGGDWTYSVDSETGMAATLFSDLEGEETDIAEFEQWDNGDSAKEMLANAKFIALTDPNTFLALLDALDEAEKENKRLKQGIIDGKAEGVSLVPNDIWDELEASNTRLREALADQKKANAKLIITIVALKS